MKTATELQAVKASLEAWRQRVGGKWAALTGRERQILGVGSGVLLLTLVWLALIQPIWRTWKTVPAQRQQLEAQWLTMRAQASQAKSLQALQALPTPEQARQALQAATQSLGAAGQLQFKGDRAELTLKSVSPDALQVWLRQARQGARIRPIEMNIRHEAQGWTGRLVLQLPATP